MNCFAHHALFGSLLSLPNELPLLPWHVAHISTALNGIESYSRHSSSIFIVSISLQIISVLWQYTQNIISNVLYITNLRGFTQGALVYLSTYSFVKAAIFIPHTVTFANGMNYFNTYRQKCHLTPATIKANHSTKHNILHAN